VHRSRSPRCDARKRGGEHNEATPQQPTQRWKAKPKVLKIVIFYVLVMGVDFMYLLEGHWLYGWRGYVVNLNKNCGRTLDDF